MCGICGIVDFSVQPESRTVQRMSDALAHRGPDAEGVCAFQSCVLGHRRLSILDLSSAANQPMLSADGSIALVFNGEIYNFLELRTDLERRGHAFRTRSDTEVILELYRVEGETLVEHLNGMFALAVWDEPRGRLFLARDRVGKKPLYYHLAPHRLTFSSELVSLVRDEAVDRRIDEQALAEYFLYDFIPGPHTILEGVFKLPPGTTAVMDRNGLQMRRYWSPPTPEPEARYKEKQTELADLLRDAVSRRLISDVPLGAFLSGGIDSTLVTSLMRDGTSGRVKTFSIGFPGTSHDESPWARLAAASLGTDHHEHPVGYAIEALFPQLVRHFGEPFGDSSAVPTWHLCRHTRRHVTVALSGDGGDELFGGYERYLARRVQLLYDRLPVTLRERLIEPVIEGLPATTDYYGTSFAKQLKLFIEAARRVRTDPLAVIPRTFSSDQLTRLTGLHYAAEADPVLEMARQWVGLDPVSQMMVTDVQTYLAEDILTKVDRMSMAHGLEVRCPLLDYRVVEFALRLPRHFKIRGMTTKRLLRDVARDHVPSSILKRRKYGFQVPLGEWLKGDLRDWAQERLLSPAHGIFTTNAVEGLWREHLTGLADHTHRLWLMLVFNEWLDQMKKTVG